MNSPQHSIYKSPNNQRARHSGDLNRDVDLPAVSLSFNTDLTGDINRSNTEGNDAAADSNGIGELDDDSSLVSSDCSSVSQGMDAFYAHFETQPPTPQTTFTPPRGGG